MNRLLALILLWMVALGTTPAMAQTDGAGLPPRPTPFKFVNDEASLMAPADAKKLDSGLRRYADNTGTQVVVVTVPSLGGRTVADYGRALGTAWGVGQRDKNNGIVVLLSAKEHQVTIQPGSGLASVITPAVTNQVISQMTPGFKQGNYFAGLRAGLNTLMLRANPSSNPRNQPGAAATSGAGASDATGMAAADSPPANAPAETSSSYPATGSEPVLRAPAEPASSGPGMGMLLLGALVIGAGLWFVVRMFRSRSAAANRPTPDFLPNRPGSNGPGAGQAPGNYGPGYGNVPNQGGGMGMGGMLATGAAAAAGAYLGNRMASGHDTSGQNLANDGSASHLDGAGTANPNAGSDYFNSGGGAAADTSAPDYFSDANTAPDNSSDYFSSDSGSSSSDDSSSGDSGGGGFDSTSDNSGSW